MIEWAAPGRARISARNRDFLWTKAIGGRVLSDREIAEVKALAVEMRRPSNPAQPSNPGRPTAAPTRPDKNPPMPPNPPGPKPGK